MPAIDVSLDWLEKVAKNARLKLTEAEKKVFLPQMKEILAAFDTLNELDVSKETPSFQPIPLQNAFRKDVLKPSLATPIALQNAVHQQAPFFKGPKAIE